MLRHGKGTWWACLGLAIGAIGLGAGCAVPGGGGGGGGGNNNDNAPDNDNGGGGTPTFQSVVSSPDAAILAVAGTSPTNVFAVGADPGDGNGSLFIQYDGTEWTRRTLGTSDAMWWITPQPIDGDMYISGDNGQIVRFDPMSGELELQNTPDEQADFRVFGVWGTSQNNVWAVCSGLGENAGQGAIWHFDGTAWTIEDISATVAELPGLIKVWGRSADEVYAVGQLRTLLQYDGTEWTTAEVETTQPATRTLFSIYGNSERIVTCGGNNIDALILESTGGAFGDATLAQQLTPSMNGVFLTDEGQGVTIGIGFSVAFLTDAGWDVQESTGLEDITGTRDFHGPWIDEDGGVWMTGGNILIEPLNQGLLAYYGAQTLPTMEF